jgi:hypothetical protein
MSVGRGPEFDELVGEEGSPADRERLRHVHDLLVTAGPPPELTPQLEAGPTLGMTLGGRTRRRMQRRMALLAAAIVVLLLAFLAGYISGNGNDGNVSSARILKLEGTSLAPNALASLKIDPVDPSGNWPMHLSAVGLPKLPPGGYYEVFLTRDSKIFAPCGSFVVRDRKTGVSVPLNAPYRLRPGDSWVVTRQEPGQHTPGTVILRPLT